MERLFTIDWKVKAVRKVSGLSSEKTTISRTSRIARFQTEKKRVALALNMRCRLSSGTLMRASL